MSQFNTLIEELGRRHNCAAEMNEINTQLLRMLKAADGNGLRMTDDECSELLMKASSNQQIYKEVSVYLVGLCFVARPGTLRRAGPCK